MFLICNLWNTVQNKRSFASLASYSHCADVDLDLQIMLAAYRAFLFSLIIALYTASFAVYTVGSYKNTFSPFLYIQMNMAISKEERKVLLKAQQGELDAVKMYNALAKTVTEEKDAALFLQLAAEEGRHAAVFKAMTGEVLKPESTKAILLPALYRVIGRKRLYPMIAKGEYDAEKKYRSVAARFSEVESVKNDERRHGDMIMSLL